MPAAPASHKRIVIYQGTSVVPLAFWRCLAVCSVPWLVLTPSSWLSLYFNVISPQADAEAARLGADLAELESLARASHERVVRLETDIEGQCEAAIGEVACHEAAVDALQQVTLPDARLLECGCAWPECQCAMASTRQHCMHTQSAGICVVSSLNLMLTPSQPSDVTQLLFSLHVTGKPGAVGSGGCSWRPRHLVAAARAAVASPRCALSPGVRRRNSS